MKGNSELPPGAQGIGDVVSHLCKFIFTKNLFIFIYSLIIVIHE